MASKAEIERSETCMVDCRQQATVIWGMLLAECTGTEDHKVIGRNADHWGTLESNVRVLAKTLLVLADDIATARTSGLTKGVQ